MSHLPTGTVTFLFTDIEGSTRLLQELRDRYPEVLEAHRRLLRAAIEQGGGYEFETQGDGLFTAFPNANDALRAAIVAQRALHKYPWPQAGTVRVRMGLHTGQPTITKSGYVGLDLHRTARICTAGHGGQILLSQTTRDLVEDDLAENLGLRDLGEHRLKDLTRPQRLFQLVVSDLRQDFPPLRSLDVLPNNLPIQLTSFIGRERETAEIKRVLSTARLVTLTGPGGAGKTRLALQAAAEVLEEFKDGTWLVELAPLSDPALVPKAVASAMNVAEQPGHTLSETLVNYLQSRTLILLLDNCEHLLQECAQLADTLLRKCQNLRILATSQTALSIAGEFAYRVPSLSLPNVAERQPLEMLVQYEGVRLFQERAVASVRDFAVTDRNAAAVVQVCHRLDGIPLAIELAAARVKVLSVEQIAQRLDDRFHLLTGGSRTALPRHQTLRAAMDWSYDLLAERERVLLQRLSVFAGGWTLEAAEAICSNGIDSVDVLDLLTQLVEKSLVLVDSQNGAPRHRLLEIVRQYSLERLVDSGEEREVRTRHRDWYLELAEKSEPTPWETSEREDRLKRLEVDWDNLRVALDWSLGAEGSEEGFRLLGALSWFWDERGYWIEGRRYLERGLSRTGSASNSAKAKVSYAAGALAYRQNDYQGATRLSEESLRLYRELDDKVGIALSLITLGAASAMLEDYDRSLRILQEGLALFRELGNKWGITRALLNLAMLALVGRDYEQAARVHEESLGLGRELGNRGFISNSLLHLGLESARQGDYGLANSKLEESLFHARQSKQTRHVAESLFGLGIVARLQGDYERALAQQREALTLIRYTGDNWRTAWVLAEIGALATSLKQHERAVRVRAATERFFTVVGRRREAFSYAPMLNHTGMLAATRHALGDHAFATFWAEGRAMTMEQAIEYALRE